MLCSGGARRRASSLQAIVCATCVFFSVPVALGGVELPAGPHRDLVYGKCRTCHDLQYVKDSKGITKMQWRGVLETMEGLGLEVSDGQRKQILAYLGTYMGPNPPAQASQSSQGARLSGKQVYANQCVSCHRADGAGVKGEFPPLAGNPDLFATPEFPALVVLNGLRGEIRVQGEQFDGQMPSFSFLSNARIAAVIQYIRSAWGNDRRGADQPTLTGDDIAAARKRELTPEEVHAYRARKRPGV